MGAVPPRVTPNATGHELVEQALREQEQRLGLLTDNVPAMIAYLDAGCRYRYANLRYRMFYAGSAAPIEGRTLAEVLGEKTWQSVRPRIEQALSGEALNFEAERRQHDDAARHVAVSLVPHRDETTGGVRGLYILVLDVTAQHQAETALREREAGLRHAQEMVGLAYVVVGPGGACQRWSENWPHLLGLPAARLPRTTRDSLALVHPEDRGRFRAVAIEAGRSRERTVLEYRMHRGDGSLIHVLQTMEPVGEPDAHGRSHWFVTMLDVTEQKRTEERVRRLNRVYAVLSGINGAIVRIRDRQELLDEACRIAVELGGFRFAWICRVDAAAGRLVPAASAGLADHFLERMCARLSLRDDAPRGHGIVARAVRENRALFVNRVEGDPLILDKGLGEEQGVRSVGVLPIALGGKAVAALGLHAAEADAFDEQEQRLLQELAGDIAFGLDHIEKEEKVRHLAYYDQLTGLANRTLLLERLAQQLSAARGAGEGLALVIVNLERFKIVNDSLGRQVGDELLRQIGARMRLAAGDETRVARVGPDQFAIVIPGLRPHEDLALRLRKGNANVTRDPFVIEGRELRVSFRSGVALFPADGADADSIFRNAEAALKKARSGEPFVFYAQEMTERIAEDLELENRLRLAVERGEFVLHYQPKLDLATKRMNGAEALIRWQSPDAGLVPPSKFIPMLEQTGLIAQVGPWALARAVEDQRRWRARGLAVPRISVNVSALELRQPEFVEGVKAALARGAPAAIDLEITESLLMENVERNVEKLKELRALGVGVAIDDFGTGYSSLGYLARLPVQALKIDRSFIVTMFEDADIMTLVSTIISLAHTLHLKVVAEGVDSESQAKILRSLRCDEVQGYLYSEPLAPEAFEALLTA
jgi:diguanylate cyclase (GGDEF)-like protein/PAS domain S-box-containing protein